MPDQQGNGTGKILLEHVVNFIKERNATALTLNVNRYNKARYFYEKRGFSVAEEVNIAIGEGYFMHDYIMEFILK